jgi:hypothetical protein
MNGIAKFHAVSHVLVQENGGNEKFVEQNPLLKDAFQDPIAEAMMSPMMNPTIDILLEMLEVGTYYLLSMLFQYYGRTTTVK